MRRDPGIDTSTARESSGRYRHRLLRGDEPGLARELVERGTFNREDVVAAPPAGSLTGVPGEDGFPAIGEGTLLDSAPRRPPRKAEDHPFSRVVDDEIEAGLETPRPGDTPALLDERRHPAP